MLLTKLPQEKPDDWEILTFLIQFIDSLPFQNTVSYATLGTLPLTVQHACGLEDLMLQHWSQGSSHPTLTYRSRGFP